MSAASAGRRSNPSESCMPSSFGESNLGSHHRADILGTFTSLIARSFTSHFLVPSRRPRAAFHTNPCRTPIIFLSTSSTSYLTFQKCLPALLSDLNKAHSLSQWFFIFGSRLMKASQIAWINRVSSKRKSSKPWTPFSQWQPRAPRIFLRHCTYSVMLP
jgi:hypothetical protein